MFARYQQANQPPGARKDTRDLVTPINKPKGISREVTKDYAETPAETPDSIEPNKRDITPQDVFKPLPKNVNVLDYALKGWPGTDEDYKDMDKALNKQIPKDKGYDTVSNLSQYLIETQGGGDTVAVGKAAMRQAGENKEAEWSKKFHQLTYWTSKNTSTSVNCDTFEKAKKIVEKSGVDQKLIKKAATMNPRKAFEQAINKQARSEFERVVYGMEFDTEEAKKKYLEEHDVKPGTKLTVTEKEDKSKEKGEKGQSRRVPSSTRSKGQ